MDGRGHPGVSGERGPGARDNRCTNGKRGTAGGRGQPARGSRGPERSKAAAMASVASGSRIAATTRSVPPQSQRRASVRNTRQRRSAHGMRAGRRGAAGHGRRRRGGDFGTTRARSGEAGAKTPKNRVRWKYGGAMSAASLARKATGEKTSSRTPPRQVRFRVKATRLSSSRRRRSPQTGGRSRAVPCHPPSPSRHPGAYRPRLREESVVSALLDEALDALPEHLRADDPDRRLPAFVYGGRPAERHGSARFPTNAPRRHASVPFSRWPEAPPAMLDDDSTTSTRITHAGNLAPLQRVAGGNGLISTIRLRAPVRQQRRDLVEHPVHPGDRAALPVRGQPQPPA